MNFQSFGFFTFLILTLAICIPTARRNLALGQILLGMASAVFCILSEHGVETLMVLLLGSLVTAMASKAMEKPAQRHIVMLLSCGYHILVLAAFKYTNFLTGGIIAPTWVPVGLSFFTFQQLWYLKERYDGTYVPGKGDRLVLYSLFFPTLTSGPILRPTTFFPQVKSEKFLHPTWDDVAAGCYGICCGTIKKVLLADSFGVIVNNGWGKLEDLTAPAAWLVILGYTFQLYFDFSGYCDIATGLGRLLGVRLPVNFNSPYRACSVTEFWKRWHITLTSFLRECVYFPLGGSRKGTGRTYVNILLIFLISGIWHGAGWTFIFWGILHGLGQVTERLWGNHREKLPVWFRWGITFAFINVAWIFFRAPDLGSAWELICQAVTGEFSKPEPWLLNGLLSKETGGLALLFPGGKQWINIGRVLLLYGVGSVAAFWPKNVITQMDEFRPTVWRAVGLTVLTVWSVLSFTGITTFIYSNF